MKETKETFRNGCVEEAAVIFNNGSLRRRKWCFVKTGYRVEEPRLEQVIDGNRDCFENDGDVIDADATRKRLELVRLPNSSLAVSITSLPFPLSVVLSFIRGLFMTVYIEVFEAWHIGDTVFYMSSIT